MATIGSAWVRVGADGKQFGPDVRRIVDTGTRNVKAAIPVLADTTRATVDLDKLKARLAEFSRTVATARLGTDDKEATAKLAAMEARLLRLDKRVSSPRIKLEGAAQVEAELLALDVSFDKLQEKMAATGVEGEAAGAGLGALGSPMVALVGAGVALSPVLVTLGLGLGGLGLAAASAISPILKAGTATKQQRDALKSLDPAQRAAYDSLGALKDQFSGFATSLEPTVLDLFNKGLGIAAGLLRDVQPVAAATGKALGGLLGAIDAEFRSQTWQKFFGFMAAQAGPDVQLVTNALIPLLDTLPRLLTTLQPIAVQFLQASAGAFRLADAAVTLNQKIDQLGSHADHSSGFLGKLADAGKRAADQMLPGIPAAQKLVGWLSKLGDSSGTAAKHTGDLGVNTNLLATSTKIALPPTQQVATNLAVEAVQAGLANDAVTRLNTAWETFLGLSTGLENAQLAVEGGLKGLHDAAKTAGASFTGTNAASQALQSAFESGLLPSTQQVIGGMRQAHAKAGDLATVIATDLKPAVDAGALSNTAFRNQLYDLAVQAGYTGPNQLKPLRDWFDRNAASTDAAKRKVDLYAGALAKVPTHVSTTLEAIASGHGGVKVTSNQVGVAAKLIALQKQGFAGGGFIAMGSGPTADDVPAMLSRGELVVPEHMVRAGLVDHLRGALPGFAGGGLIGGVSAYPGAVNSAFTSDASAALSTDVNATVNAMAAAIRRAAALHSSGFPSLGNLSPNLGAVAALNLAASRYGWNSGAEWNALNYVEMREAGYNIYARNPSSGAYGMAQFINGPSEYYQYGGNPNTAYGQSVGMVNYIRQRYGDAIAAANHERNFNWYARGGLVGMASGGTVPRGFSPWLSQVKATQAREVHDWSGLWWAFLKGPRKYLTKPVLTRLRALEKKEYAEQVAYNALVTHATGKLADLTALPARMALLGSRVAGAKGAIQPSLLGRLPGGHPGWVKSYTAELARLATLTGHQPALPPWAPGNLGPSHHAGPSILTFDQGGRWPSGTFGWNGSGKTETVIPGGASGEVHVHLNLTVNGPVGSQAELKNWFVRTANEAARTGYLTQAVRTATSGR